MGDYTNLRAVIYLRKEFVRLIEKLSESKTWENLGYDFTDEFSKDDRSSHIPFMASSYMPDEWFVGDSTNVVHKKYTSVLKDDIWLFQCSLKDYNSTIDKFFDLIVPKIAERCLIESFFWEDEHSRFYELVEGRVTLFKEENKNY